MERRKWTRVEESCKFVNYEKEDISIGEEVARTVNKENSCDTSVSARLKNHSRICVSCMVYPNTNLRLGDSLMTLPRDHISLRWFWL